jgi:hypothetical protein
MTNPKWKMENEIADKFSPDYLTSPSPSLPVSPSPRLSAPVPLSHFQVIHFPPNRRIIQRNQFHDQEIQNE